MKFSEILTQLETVSHSEVGSDPEISGLAAVDQAAAGTISYIEGNKYADWVGKTTASALILPENHALQAVATARGISWLSTPEPRLVFAKVINLFYQPFKPPTGIHPTAVIDPTVVLGKEVYIGPYVVIHSQVTIGDGVCIHPNVVIYPQVTIGNHTTLHGNCTIHEHTEIGLGCVIHSGAVIGAEGFGFVPTPEGWYKMQQSGKTVLEDGVEIGCNSTVDRPAVGETRIGKNTKLDNQVHIGHGCEIGANCALAGQSGLAGGVTLGNRVIIAGQVGIVNQAKVGDGAIAAARAGIHSDIKPGETVAGTPAISHKQFLKIAAVTLKLPEMYQFFKQAQKKTGIEKR